MQWLNLSGYACCRLGYCYCNLLAIICSRDEQSISAADRHRCILKCAVHCMKLQPSCHAASTHSIPDLRILGISIRATNSDHHLALPDWQSHAFLRSKAGTVQRRMSLEVAPVRESFQQACALGKRETATLHEHVVQPS